MGMFIGIRSFNSTTKFAYAMVFGLHKYFNYAEGAGFDEVMCHAGPELQAGLTRFTDLTNEEYMNTFLGAEPPRLGGMNSYMYTPERGESLPDLIDWREYSSSPEFVESHSKYNF